MAPPHQQSPRGEEGLVDTTLTLEAHGPFFIFTVHTYLHTNSFSEFVAPLARKGAILRRPYSNK